VQWIFEFEGKHLKSVAKGLADIGDDRDLTAKVRSFPVLWIPAVAFWMHVFARFGLSGRLTSSSGMSGGCGTGHDPNLENS